MICHFLFVRFFVSPSASGLELQLRCAQHSTEEDPLDLDISEKTILMRWTPSTFIVFTILFLNVFLDLIKALNTQAIEHHDMIHLKRPHLPIAVCRSCHLCVFLSRYWPLHPSQFFCQSFLWWNKTCFTRVLLADRAYPVLHLISFPKILQRFFH